MIDSQTSNKLIVLLIFLFVICTIIFTLLFFKDNIADYPEIIGIDEITFLEIDGSELLLTATLVLENENNFDISLTKIDAQLFIDNDLIGLVQDESQYKIKRNGLEKLTFPAKIDLEKVSLVFPQLLDKDSVNIVVKGRFTTDTILTDIEFEMETEKEVSMRSEVNRIISQKLSTDAFMIDKVSLKEVGFLNTGLGLEINIKNDFGIDFEVKNIQCDLLIQGNQSPFGNWQYSQAIQIEAKSFQNLDGEAQINNPNALLQLTTAVFGSQNLLIDCKANVELANYMFDIPFKQTMKIGNIVGI